MADVAAFLVRSALFGNIPSRELTALAGVAREQRYRPREFIFLEATRPTGSASCVRGA